MRIARPALAIWTMIGYLLLFVPENKAAEGQGIQPNQAVEHDVPKVDQGWTDEERDRFYSISGGSFLLPCSWFLSLEQKDSEDLIVADHNMKQLYLVPASWAGKQSNDGKKEPGCNSEQLPVGIAIMEMKDPQLSTLDSKWVGMNCAFCHTGIMRYTKEHPDNGKKVQYELYINGGASMQYNYRFLAQLLEALSTTLADSDKFKRFAERVHEICEKESGHTKPCENDVRKLRRQVKDYTHRLLSRASIEIVEWGFGRIDALGRGGNLVFSNLHPDNQRNVNAPVSIPPLWYAWRYNVVQWSGLIRHPIARNISQTIGVGAGLFECNKEEPECIKKLSNPKTAFSSTTNVRNIIELEDLIHVLKPPDWPEDVLGKIDAARATKGKQLYADKCAYCHVPLPLLKNDSTPTQKARGQLLSVKIVPRNIPGKNSSEKRSEEIGTDPLYLINASFRSVSTVSPIGDLRRPFDGQAVLPMPDAIRLVTKAILKKAKDAGVLKHPYDDISDKDNLWEPPRAKKGGAPIVGYMARPHSAVWSTPPFLHNGSVPTLYDLLTPSFLPEHKMTSPAEWDKTWRETWRKERGSDSPIRPKCFLVGDLEFDPEKVGYKVRPCDVSSRPDNPDRGFNFITAKPGNSNEGHEFSDYDRQTLKEFSEADCKDFAKKKSRDGILGCGLSHDERLAIIEYLKTCDLDDLLEWKPGATQKKWDQHAPPRTTCRRPISLAKS